MYASPEFMAQYSSALAGEQPPEQRATSSASLESLIHRYQKSPAWNRLSEATKRQRLNLFKHVIDRSGAEPYDAIRKQDIQAGMATRTDAQATNFLKAMRGLFLWALEQELVTVDPTLGVKSTTPKMTGGFAVWTESDIDRFEAFWPLGTRERLAMTILLYTGLRRGDAAVLGPGHVVNGVIEIETEKNGTPVAIPILPELAKVIAASPIGESTFIARQDSKPMTKESLGNFFHEACDAARVSKSAHGLRKIGATRAANAGATVAQLEAIFGWSGGKMASLYTRSADRRRLAREGMDKLSK
ncbi:MAG: tyrosine-type recombinase/integrase [Methylocella sp.]|jgi:integrase